MSNLGLSPGDWFCIILAILGLIGLCWYMLMEYLTEKARYKYGNKGKEKPNGDSVE